MAQITCKDLSFAYDGETVLSDINFSIDAGAYLCIVGENGSGKSTLMRGILGLKHPSKGEIIFDDLKPTEIGYLPQQTQIQRDFPASVSEVVLSGRLNSMHGRLFCNAEDKAAAAANMERLGIDDIADRCYLELSGGQQQRVLLARAMCATKKLLLLDEPVTGLDPVAANEMYNLIKLVNLCDNTSVIMISHDIHAARALCYAYPAPRTQPAVFRHYRAVPRERPRTQICGRAESMIELIKEMFSYHFMIRAVVVGILVSLCAALLGVSLVLKRYSMIGDGLSHVGFGALAIAAAANIAPLYLAVPVVIAAAFLLLRINQNSRIKGDAAIALISSSALAVGVVTVSLTTGMNTDVSNYMFGSILSLSRADAVLSIILSAAVLLMFVLLYPRIFAVTFDETFARATGTKTQLINSVIAVLTAVTVVIGMRMMGALLISSLIIFPALTAMRLCRSFKAVVICSAVVSVLCFMIGMAASYAFELPSGAAVVIVNLIAFASFSFAALLKKRA